MLLTEFKGLRIGNILKLNNSLILKLIAIDIIFYMLSRAVITSIFFLCCSVINKRLYRKAVLHGKKLLGLQT